MNSQTSNLTVSIRNTIFLLFSVFIMTSYLSCDKDPMQVEPVAVSASHQADLYIGSISGTVLNENSEALEGVHISIRGQEVITDKYGYFNLQETELDAQGTVIVATKENYWTITKMVVPSKMQQNQTKIMLLPQATTSTIIASDGGLVNFDDAVKVDFPENAFADRNGDSYDGQVEVSIIHLDPNDENFALISPGDFRAFNTVNELQTLLSLGMAAVELRGSNNEELELKEGMPATISIKVPDGTDIEEIPLWHFDEVSGYWLEEGIATRVGDFYVGKVSHFSWWNCDVPYPAVKLSGVVINENGMGVSGLQVSIILADELRNMGSEYTGNRGIFCGLIPKDVDLIIQIRNECGDIFYEEPIGPFTVDINLFPISTIDQNMVEICGKLLDCNFNNISNGYIVVEHSGNATTLIPVDLNGSYCSIVDICKATSFEIYGVDSNLNIQGQPISFNFSDSPIKNLENIACGEVFSFFKFQIDDEPEVELFDFTINFFSSNEFISVNKELEDSLWNISDFYMSSEDWWATDVVIRNFVINLENNNGDDLNCFNIVNPNDFICDGFISPQPSIEMYKFGGIGNPIRFKMEGISNKSQNYTIRVNGILELME